MRAIGKQPMHLRPADLRYRSPLGNSRNPASWIVQPWRMQVSTSCNAWRCWIVIMHMIGGQQWNRTIAAEFRGVAEDGLVERAVDAGDGDGQFVAECLFEFPGEDAQAVGLRLGRFGGDRSVDQGGEQATGVIQQIRRFQLAFAFFCPAFADGKQSAQAGHSRAVFRPHQHLRAIGKHQPRSDAQLDTHFLCRRVCPDNAGDAVHIGDGDRGDIPAPRRGKPIHPDAMPRGGTRNCWLHPVPHRAMPILPTPVAAAGAGEWWGEVWGSHFRAWVLRLAAGPRPRVFDGGCDEDARAWPRG